MGEVGEVAAEGVIDGEVALTVEEAERTRGTTVKRKNHARKVRKMRRDDIVARMMGQMT